MKWILSVLMLLACCLVASNESSASDRFVSRSRSVVVNRGFGGFGGRSVIVDRGFSRGFGGSVVIDRGFGHSGFGRSVIIDRGGFGCGRSVIVEPGFRSRTIFRSSFGF